jgi:hypothetical protein
MEEVPTAPAKDEVPTEEVFKWTPMPRERRSRTCSVLFSQGAVSVGIGRTHAVTMHLRLDASRSKVGGARFCCVWG